MAVTGPTTGFTTGTTANPYGGLWAAGTGFGAGASSVSQIGSTDVWKQVYTNSMGTGIFAIKYDNTLWAQGYNAQGQLGTLNATSYSSFVQIAIGSTWSTVSPGYDHTLAVKTDGTLWGWGDNYSFQLTSSSPTGTRISSPIQIGISTNWSSIFCGYRTSYAIKTDGTLWAWGNFLSGDGTLNNYSSPVQVSPTTSWKYITSGWNPFGSDRNAFLALRADGTLWGWGINTYGQLGLGNTNTYSSPVQIGTGTWAQVSCGYFSTVALKNDGTMWAWGRNNYGQLGIPGQFNVSFSSPVQIGLDYYWKQVSANGNKNMFAIRNDGTAWGCGYNYNGTFGINSVTNSPSGASQISSLIQVGGGMSNWEAIYPNYFGSFFGKEKFSIPLDLGSRYISKDYLIDAYPSIAASAGAVTPGLWTAGGGSAGELGINDTVNVYSSFVQVSGNTWNNLSDGGGYNFTWAIRNDGTLWGWGSNNNGQVGDGTGVSRASPVQIGTENYWNKVSGGTDNSFAIRNDGTAWGVGYNGYGNLGITPSFTPDVRVSSPVQFGVGNTWKQITGGAVASTLAIRSDNTLWVAGENQNGMFGTNESGVFYSSPTQVGSLSDWKQVSVGLSGFSMAIKTDGSLWGMGSDGGQFGRGLLTTLAVSSPVQIGSGRDWKSVTVHPYGGWSAIKNDGTLWACGDNGNGALGNGTTNTLSSLTQIGSLTNWKQIYTPRNSNYKYALAIKTDGTLWALGGMNINGCWGDAIGHDTFISSPVQLSTLTTWKSVCPLNSSALYIKDGYI